jgi:hypothetical protein
MSSYRRAYGVNGPQGTTRTSCRAHGLAALAGSRIRRRLARRIVVCHACGGDGLSVTRERTWAPQVCRDGVTRPSITVVIHSVPCTVCHEGRLLA